MRGGGPPTNGPATRERRRDPGLDRAAWLGAALDAREAVASGGGRGGGGGGGEGRGGSEGERLQLQLRVQALEVGLAQERRTLARVRGGEVKDLQEKLATERRSREAAERQLGAALRLLEEERGMAGPVAEAAVREEALRRQAEELEAELSTTRARLGEAEGLLSRAEAERGHALQATVAASDALAEGDQKEATFRSLLAETSRALQVERERAEQLEVRAAARDREAGEMRERATRAMAEALQSKREAQKAELEAGVAEKDLEDCRAALQRVRAERAHEEIEHERLIQARTAENAANVASMARQRDDLQQAVLDIRRSLAAAEGRAGTAAAQAMEHVERAIETRHRSLDVLVLQSVAHRHVLSSCATEVGELADFWRGELPTVHTSLIDEGFSGTVQEMRSWLQEHLRALQVTARGLTEDLRRALPRAVKQAAAVGRALAVRDAAEKALSMAAVGLESSHIAATLERMAAGNEKQARRYHRTLPADIMQRLRRSRAPRPVSMAGELWGREVLVQEAVEQVLRNVKAEASGPVGQGPVGGSGGEPGSPVVSGFSPLSMGSAEEEGEVGWRGSAAQRAGGTPQDRAGQEAEVPAAEHS